MHCRERVLLHPNVQCFSAPNGNGTLFFKMEGCHSEFTSCSFWFIFQFTITCQHIPSSYRSWCQHSQPGAGSTRWNRLTQLPGFCLASPNKASGLQRSNCIELGKFQRKPATDTHTTSVWTEPTTPTSFQSFVGGNKFTSIHPLKLRAATPARRVDPFIYYCIPCFVTPAWAYGPLHVQGEE